MALSFRPAREEDLDRLIVIHSSAYPDGRTHDARARNFTANPLGTLDDLWVAHDRGLVVAHAFLFRMHAWFGGARVAVGGIASVGVAPESRGSGVASRLLAHLHAAARERGDALTVLYPFRQGFYTQLGYAATTPYRQLQLSPAAVPWKQELTVRAAGGADRDAMKSTWEAAGRARTGMHVRTESVWRARLTDERATWLVVDGDRGVEGHVAWTVEQTEPEGATTLAILEMAARSDRAARSLWAAVAAQRDQVTEVRVDVADDDPIDRAFVDPDRDRFGSLRAPHPIGRLALGPMVRIVDVERALLSRGWLGSGRLALDAGEGTVVLSVEDGVATLSPSRIEPALTLDRATLAALAFGGLRPSQAARFGWVTARREATLGLADAVLGLPAYFSPERF